MIDPAFPRDSISRGLVGDPIDVVSGANIDVTVDLRLHGPIPLAWRRYYNSARREVSCDLGWGHSHDFQRTLTRVLDGLHYTDPFGTEVPFPFLAPGETACTSGLTLSRSGHDSYQLLQAFEAVQVFEFSDAGDMAPLRRLRLGGAQIELSYDVTGRLIEIVDSLGRPIVLDWIP